MSLDCPVSQGVGLPMRRRAPTDGMRYGIELEYENANGAPHVEGWNTHPDGSLRNGGIEFVSEILHPEEVDDRVSALMEALPASYQAGPRCGLHIHMNMLPLNVGQLYSFMTACVLLEPALFALYCPERVDSSFCVPSYRNEHWQAMAHMSLQRARVSDLRPLFDVSRTSKYCAMNTAALSRFGTLEFRQLPSTRSAREVLNWIDTLTRIHDRAIMTPDPTGIVALYEGLGLQQFQRTYLDQEVQVTAREQQQAHRAAICIAGYPEPAWEELDWPAPVQGE